MKKYFVKSITIEGFRGINNKGSALNINFQSDGVTSIFGENGKGKSSIFEAFLFTILGRIVRFDDYHGDILDKKTIKNIFHSGNGTINIKFIDQSKNIVDIDVQIDDNGGRTLTSTTISNPEAFLNTLCNNLNFIDYVSFQKIMLSSSEETGKLFSHLVGFGNFIKIKEKLDKISRLQNINNDFGKSTKETLITNNLQRIVQIQTEIQEKINAFHNSSETYEESKVLGKLKAFLKKRYKIQLKPIKQDSQLEFDNLIKNKVGESYENNILLLTSNQQTQFDLNSALRSISNFDKKVIKKLKTQLKTSYKEILKEDIILGQLYDEAINGYNTILDYDRNQCILCNTENLGSRANSFYEQINFKIIGYLKFKEKYQLFLSDFVRHLESSKVFEIEEKFYSPDNRVLKNLTTSKSYISENFFELDNLTSILKKYKLKIKEELKFTSLTIKNLQKTIPPKVSELIEENNIYKFIFHSIIEIKKLDNANKYLTAYLYELEQWISFVNKLKTEYEDAYNDLMDEIATMIDGDTKLFFKDIMGNIEITPKLKKEYRGQKVNILLEKFYTNTSELKAVPLLSESYRNALSLSIYFAASLKSKNAGNFIIVDDITSSFDSGHQIFLLELIKKRISISSTNKHGKQIIFLTHDGSLKKLLNENGNSQKNWSHFTLNSNKDQVSLNPITSNDLRTNLIDKINSNQYEGSGLRLYYESVLLEIIEKLNLEIPYNLINNNDEKMVNKLIQAISEIVEIKVKGKRIKKTLVPDKADFKTYIQQFGNNLSHWASASQASLSTSALVNIVDQIGLFKQKFQYNCTCPKNAGWVYYKGLLKNPTQKGCLCIL